MKKNIVNKGLFVLFTFCFLTAPVLAKPILWQGTAVEPGEKPLSGLLTISLIDGMANGNIGGLSAKGVIDDQKHFTLTFAPQVSVELSAGSGSFRGYITKENELRGHWVRYGMQKRSSSPYANPVRFSQDADAYKGLVTPLDDSLSIFFIGEPISEGRYALNVFIPETNAGRFVRNAELLLIEDKATVVQISEGSEEEIATGSYDATTGSFNLHWPYWGGDIHFEKQIEDPRGLLAGKENQPYQIPTQENDGWPVGNANELGIDSSVLQDFANMLKTSPPQSPFEAQTEAFLLARDGVLIFESYFRGYDSKIPHDLRSASKSLTGILPGLVEQKARNDQSDLAGQNNPPSLLQERIYQVLGVATDSPQKQNMTLEHALSMSTGLECDDGQRDSPGNENTMQEQQDEPNWFRYILELDAIHEPGSHMAYCSGGINLAGPVLTATTNQWVPALIEELFARPLGIEQYNVNLLPDGQQAYSGGGLQLRARDFLKLGQLMLDKGRWHNQQLLASSYVENVLTSRGTMSGDEYGLGWWMRTYELGDRSYRVFYAGGNGGQQIIAVPELDMVAVFLGSAYGTRGTFKVRDDWFPNIILDKAIINATE